MYISFTPIRHDGSLTLHKSGDTLSINGQVFDFSFVSNGATLPQAAVDCIWLASDVERIEGVLHMTLQLPHGADTPTETLFPEPMHITVDGAIAVPQHSITPENHFLPTGNEEPHNEH